MFRFERSDARDARDALLRDTSAAPHSRALALCNDVRLKTSVHVFEETRPNEPARLGECYTVSAELFNLSTWDELEPVHIFHLVAIEKGIVNPSALTSALASMFHKCVEYGVQHVYLAMDQLPHKTLVDALHRPGFEIVHFHVAVPPTATLLWEELEALYPRLIAK